LGCLQAAKDARYDKEAVTKFFRMVSDVFDNFILYFLFNFMGCNLNFHVSHFS
jgi:hypothetical protein